MKSPPKGWPRISSSVVYRDPKAAIDFLCRAIGFEVQLKVEGDDGKIHHSQLVFGDGLIMIGSGDGSRDTSHRKSPLDVGGANTQGMMIFCDDVDALTKRAAAAGAKVHREPTTNDYGEEYWTDRSSEIEDPEGHRWFLVQRIRPE